MKKAVVSEKVKDAVVTVFPGLEGRAIQRARISSTQAAHGLRRVCIIAHLYPKTNVASIEEEGVK